ncbi:hypothetical protein F4677DRAFT_464137 [Hypoxylon crocopeplum]|nr:hypothetical protein F4677DRAFT_464137 [Hypoxylon crocopeplum]
MSIHMRYREACASGLFGLFAEETSIHVDVQDPRQMEKLSAAYSKAYYPARWGRTRGISELREFLSNGRIDDYITTFLQCVKTIWFKTQKVLTQEFIADDLIPKHEKLPWIDQLLRRLPRFRFVVAVHLCMSEHKDPDEFLSTADADEESNGDS